MNDTRFPELGYTNIADHWRIIDTKTGAAVGPQYETKAELLADLERFATVFGAIMAGLAGAKTDLLREFAEHVLNEQKKLGDQGDQEYIRLAETALGIPATDRIFVLIADMENNGSRWWDAARSNLNLFSPEIAQWLSNHNEHISVSEKEGMEFLRVARSLPGWNNGPSYAPNPVIFDIGR